MNSSLGFTIRIAGCVALAVGVLVGTLMLSSHDVAQAGGAGVERTHFPSAESASAFPSARRLAGEPSVGRM